MPSRGENKRRKPLLSLKGYTKVGCAWNQGMARLGDAKDRRLVRLASPRADGRSHIVRVFPSARVKGQERLDCLAGDFYTALKPRLPADVAARYERAPPVNDDKLRVHHTEREEEETLDLQLNAAGFKQGGLGQAEFLRPCRGRVDVAVAGLWV